MDQGDIEDIDDFESQYAEELELLRGELDGTVCHWHNFKVVLHWLVMKVLMKYNTENQLH